MTMVQMDARTGMIADSLATPPDMRHLYVIGGEQRQLRPLRAGGGDWYEYQKAIILQVDTVAGTAQTCVTYTTPPEACGEKDPIILFKSCTLVGDTLYACTQTEVLLYAVPSFKLVTYISLPFFNDVHHVRPTPEGNLLVANTGLDMVVELTRTGETLRLWNTLGEQPWERFSRDVDYRKGVSTKPHQSHPNHVFYVGDEPWVTRFQQKDAMALEHPNRRIALNVERVHDGVVHDGLIYFTSVNGHVIVANPDTLQVEDDIDLQTMHDENVMLGWCRSIHVVGDLAWVGFSRLRPTKLRENVSWVRNGFKQSSPTHIGLYDLAHHRCLAEVDVEALGLNAVFTICPAVEPRKA